MRDASDILTVSFDSGVNDEAALCVTRKQGDRIIMLKMELGEQADILYHLLTDQMAKAEIKEETLSILDCAKKIKEHCINAKWCFDCELGNGDGTCKLADNEYCYSLPTEWKLEEEKDGFNDQESKTN